jgi:TRAP-type transport system periplasmic protein
MRATRRIVLGSALAAPFIRTAHAEALTMRVSLDTSPTHGRTLSIADFLKKLEAASQGAIAPRLFDSGQLFADRDVIKAMELGQLDMCAPGTWLVAAYVPEADFAQLPVFYGQPVEVTRKATDGIPGNIVNEQLGRKLRVVVPGRWLDLGFTNWYSTRRRLESLEDLKGLKIRNSGGFAQPWRAQFFEAIPNMTPWPDVPLALSQGTFDALQTTNESCASAKLWDAGLRHALIDHQTMGGYIPLISGAFWAKLPPALQTLVADLWAANIGTYRNNLIAAQDRAEAALKASGVTMTYVPAATLADVRSRMLDQQDKVAQAMKISPEALSRITAAVSAA